MSEEAPNQLPERITTRKILAEISDILNLQRGAPYTLWRTLISPGKTIYTYLRQDRSKLMNSFRLLVLVVTIGTFISLKFNLTEIAFKDNVNITLEGNPASQEEVMQLTKEIFNSYLSLFSFLLVPFLGLFTYWFFKRAGYNTAEHITAQAFIVSLLTAIGALFTPMAIYVPKIFPVVYLLIAVAYQIRYCLSLPNHKTKTRTVFAALGSFFAAYFIYYLIIGIVVGIQVGYTLAGAAAN